jgi:hypothetical protein
MAFSSFNAKLMYNSSSTETPTWTQVIAIKNIPQIGGAPEQLETTTLDDAIQTFIDGIQSQEIMSFTINADKTKRATLTTLKGVEKSYSIWLGNDGLGGEGKFTGKGKLNYYINEAGNNAVVEMTVTITPTTAFEEETA